MTYKHFLIVLLYVIHVESMLKSIFTFLWGSRTFLSKGWDGHMGYWMEAWVKHEGNTG